MEESIQDVLDEREIGNQISSSEKKRLDTKQQNYDIIKPIYYDDINNGSEAMSDKEKGHNLTQYDKEQLQLRIEAMKREINQCREEQNEE